MAPNNRDPLGDLAARMYERQRQGVGQEGGPPGFGSQACEQSQLVHQPGADIVNRLQHPVFRTFEHAPKKLPEASWVAPTVSSARPIFFNITPDYKVPHGQHLWLMDYEFIVYRLSGVDASDWVRLEEGRLQGSMGFDISVNGKRSSDLFYQLQPSPVEFTPTLGRVANASTAAATSIGPGTSLLPLRPNVQGARNAPFTIIVEQGQTVKLLGGIFRPLGITPAAVEGRIAGYLLSVTVSEALQQRMRPR